MIEIMPANTYISHIFCITKVDVKATHYFMKVDTSEHIFHFKLLELKYRIMCVAGFVGENDIMQPATSVTHSWLVYISKAILNDVENVS